MCSGLLFAPKVALLILKIIEYSKTLSLPLRENVRKQRNYEYLILQKIKVLFFPKRILELH